MIIGWNRRLPFLRDVSSTGCRREPDFELRGRQRQGVVRHELFTPFKLWRKLFLRILLSRLLYWSYARSICCSSVLTLWTGKGQRQRECEVEFAENCAQSELGRQTGTRRRSFDAGRSDQLWRSPTHSKKICAPLGSACGAFVLSSVDGVGVEGEIEGSVVPPSVVISLRSDASVVIPRPWFSRFARRGACGIIALSAVLRGQGTRRSSSPSGRLLAPRALAPLA